MTHLICTVAGINNCAFSLARDGNRIAGLDSVVKAMHQIIDLLGKSSTESSIAFIRIPKVPMLHLNNRGFLVDGLNKVFRVCNAAISTAWGTNARYAPNFKLKGIFTPSGRNRGTPAQIWRSWFRETEDIRMLHFKTLVKVELGREILQFWGINRGTALGPNVLSRF